MSNKQYQLQIFESNKYVPFSDKGVRLETASLKIFGDGLIDEIKNFTNDYSQISVPQEVLTILEDLLDKFSLNKHKSEFLTLICATQSAYILYLNDNKDLEMITDFVHEKKNFQNLLNVLGKYLLAEDRNILHSISFKYKKGATIPIKNFFIINDIYSKLCKTYGLTKENFYIQREELLINYNNFDYEKACENMKHHISKKLSNFVTNANINKSDANRFVISFLYL